MHTIIPGGFAGNGRTQFLVVQNGYWFVAGYANAGFTTANTGLVPGGEYGAADFDGDGRADLMAQSGGLTPTIHVRRKRQRFLRALRSPFSSPRPRSRCGRYRA